MLSWPISCAGPDSAPPHEELEKRVAKGYEATVEELLHPELQPPALDDEDLLKRYHVTVTI